MRTLIITAIKVLSSILSPGDREQSRQSVLAAMMSVPEGKSKAFALIRLVSISLMLIMDIWVVQIACLVYLVSKTLALHPEIFDLVDRYFQQRGADPKF